MICPKCGRKLPKHAKFCIKCGADITTFETEENSKNKIDFSGVEAVKKGSKKKVIIAVLFVIFAVIIALTGIITVKMLNKVDGKFPIEEGKVHIKLPSQITCKLYTSNKGEGKPKNTEQINFNYNDQGFMTSCWSVKGSEESAPDTFKYDKDGIMIDSNYNKNKKEQKNSTYYVEKNGKLLGIKYGDQSIVFEYDSHNRIKAERIAVICGKKDSIMDITYNNDHISNITFDHDGLNISKNFEFSGDNLTQCECQLKDKDSKNEFNEKFTCTYDKKQLSRVNFQLVNGLNEIDTDYTPNYSDEGYVSDELYSMDNGSLRLEYKYTDIYIDKDSWIKYQRNFLNNFFNYVSAQIDNNDLSPLISFKFCIFYDCLDQQTLQYFNDAYFGDDISCLINLNIFNYNNSNNTCGEAILPDDADVKTVDSEYVLSDEFLHGNKEEQRNFQFEIANSNAKSVFSTVNSCIADWVTDGKVSSDYEALDIISGEIDFGSNKNMLKDSSYNNKEMFDTVYNALKDQGGIVYIGRSSSDSHFYVQWKETSDSDIIGQYPDSNSDINNKYVWKQYNLNTKKTTIAEPTKVDGKFPVENGKVHIKLPSKIILNKPNDNDVATHTEFSYEYDNRGLLISCNQTGNIHEYNSGYTTYKFDDDGEFIDEFSGGIGNSALRLYIDNDGRLIGSTIQHQGYISYAYEYDNQDRIKAWHENTTKVAEPYSSNSTVSYDKNGHISEIKTSTEDFTEDFTEFWKTEYNGNNLIKVEYKWDTEFVGEHSINNFTYDDNKLVKVNWENGRGEEQANVTINYTDDGYIFDEVYSDSTRLEYEYTDIYVDKDFWVKYKRNFLNYFLKNHISSIPCTFVGLLVYPQPYEFYILYDCVDQRLLGSEIGISLNILNYNSSDNSCGKAIAPNDVGEIKTVDSEYVFSDEFIDPDDV